MATKFAWQPEDKSRSLSVFLLVLAVVLLPIAGKAVEKAPLVEEGAEVEVELAGGGSQAYLLSLNPGDFLSVSVLQKGIDVSLRLNTPEGVTQVEVDGPGEGYSEESLVAVAQTAGDHLLEILSSDPQAKAGSFVLKIEAIRPAGQADEQRVIAQSSFQKAQELLYGQRSAERIRQAIEELSQAVAIQEELLDERGLCWSLHALGWAYALVGDQRNALVYLLKVLPIRRRYGGADAESKTLQSIGAGYQVLGEPEKALEFLSRALTARRETGDLIGQSVTLHSLGMVHLELGDFDEASACYKESLALARTVKSGEDEFNAINSLGSLYARIGEDDQASALYERAQEIALREGLRLPQAIATNQLGTVLYKSGRFEEARGSFRRALALFQELGYQPGTAQMLQNIGAILAKKGDSEEALSTLEQALSLWRTLGNRRAEAACLNLLGAIEKQLQRWSSSKEHILEALAIQREISDRVGEAESLLALARLNRAREENSLALELIENAVSILESVRSEIRRDELRSGFLSSRRVYYEFFVDLLMDSDRAHSKADVEAKAFHTTERARARLLLDILSDGKLKRGISPDLLERLTSLQRRINLTDRERLRLLDRKSQNQRIVVLERDLDDMLKELDTVRAEIRARSPKYAALTQPEPLRAEEIQALLGPDDLLLSYFLGEERGFVWAVTRSSLIAKDLPPGNEIESAARELHDLLSQSDKRLARKPTEQAASRLAGMILTPVRKLLGKNRLVIVADGALHYVPFAALPDPARPGQPLVVEHEIVNLPSASVLALLRKETGQRAPAPREVAILADPVFRLNDPRVHPQTAALSGEPLAEETGVVLRAAKDVGLDGFPRLRYTREEADAIASLVEPGQALKALDFDASKETATSGDLSRYRILHFATHGLLDTKRPELSGLVLSLVDPQGKPRDGFLRLHEIYNLDLPADLVVLSGCETALGKEVRGEGLMALTRGFMYAGSPAVVASLWQIDDRSTGELMKRFYRGMLQQGLSAPAALRKAQVSLWKDKPTEPPYFWAGFVFQGDWESSSTFTRH